jgi:AAA ATPase domain
MARSTSLAPKAVADGISGRHAIVCGIDLSGFTRWVDRQIASDGMGGLEAVADDLSAFFFRAGDVLSRQGFSIGCLLGDGLLAAKFCNPYDGRDARIEARARVAIAELDPWARFAFGDGPVELRDFFGLRQRRYAVLAGDAVRNCQHELQRLPRRGGERRPPASVQPSLDRFGAAEIREQIVGFVALRHANFAILAAAVDQRLTAWEAGAEAAGGVFDRMSYDDDALLLRFCWPSGSAWRETAGAFLDDAVRACPDSVQAAAGLAQGPVFRARFGGMRSLTGENLDIAQGSAINHAAKDAKRGLDRPAPAVALARASLPSNAGPPVLAREVIGRVTERAWLSCRLEQPGPNFLMVTGEPGIGKSTLVAHASREQGDRFAVATVRATPGAILEPLRIWREACAQFARAEGLSRPEEGSADLTQVKSVDGALTEIHARLTRWVDERPLLITIDDVQWADTYSLRLIETLTRIPFPITILATARSGYPEVAALVEVATSIELLPMPPCDIQSLARLLKAESPALVAKLAGGNPFHATQLALKPHRADHGTGNDYRAVLDARLGQLNNPCLSALRLYAIVDSPIRKSEISALCKAGGIDDCAEATALLREAQLLAPDDQGRHTISHRLIQERVVEQIPPSARLRISAVVARLTSSRLWPEPPSPGVVGDHWRTARQWARSALAYSRDAQRALDQSAHAMAAELFKRAETMLERVSASPERMAVALSGHGFAAWGSGEVAVAISDADRTSRAIASAIPGWRARLRVLRAVALGRPQLLSSRLRMSFVRWAALRAELGFFSGRLGAILSGGLVVARLSDDREAARVAKIRSVGLFALGLGLFGFKPLALAIFGTCQRAGQNGPGTAYAFCAEALLRSARGEWKDAETCIRSSETRLGIPPDRHLQGALLCIRALSSHMRGETQDSLIRFDALLYHGRERANRQFEAWALYGSVMPLIAGRRFDDCDALLAEAERLLRNDGDLLSRLNCEALRAQLAWIQSQPDEALQHITSCLGLANAIFPANFGSLDGFTLPALIAAEITADEHLGRGLRDHARDMYALALATSRRFCRFCAIGAPRLTMTRALMAPSDLRPRFEARARIQAKHYGISETLLSARSEQ